MARKSKHIQDGSNDMLLQGCLFEHPNLTAKPRFNPWPRLSRQERDIDTVLAGARKHVHIDLEFNAKRPTILGTANEELAVSIPWSTFQARKVVEHCQANGKTLVAFSTCGADKKELDKALGAKTPLSLWEDAMLTHYLDNAELTKEPGKSEGDDESESGSLGLMNLGASSMLYTDLPMWKACAGIACSGPCPTHDVWGYNAVDAWAGGQVFRGSLRGMAAKGIPFQFYRELLEVSDLCDEMQTQGVLVDRRYITDLSRRMEEGKAAIFPFRMSGKKPIFDGPFNPKSPKQVKEYFYTHNVPLDCTDKDAIETTLEQACRKAKIPLGEKQSKYEALNEKYGLWPWSSERECKVTAADDDDVLFQLFRLYLFKSSGKGVDSWFADEYIDLNGRIHSRYNITGTCTGRLSSSRPNCYSADTDILTNSGWKRFNALSDADSVAQWDPAGTITFVKPVAYYAAPYSGEMIELDNQQVSLRVTSNHRCPTFIRKPRRSLAVYLADELPEDRIQPQAGSYPGGPGLGLSRDQITLLCAIQADAHVTPNNKAIYWGFTKSRKINRLRASLLALDIPFREWPYLSNSLKEGVRFSVDSAFFPAVRQLLDLLGDKKQFGPWLFNATRQELDWFVGEVFLWDGLAAKRTMFSSSVEQNADIVQAALLLSDIRATKALYHNGNPRAKMNFLVNTSTRNYSMTTNLNKRRESVENEMVYCVEVPTGFVVVRRNGKACISGNSQNIPKRGEFGKTIRRALIPDPGYKLVKADFSQLELRVCLYLAGVDPSLAGRDCFTWLVKQADGKFDEAAARYNMKPRDIAKSIAHAGNYLEGLQVVYPRDTGSAQIKRETAAGARLIFKDWEYAGGLVSFTGANLAQRLFGDKSLVNRKKALEIQSIYYGAFPQIRRWQRTVTESIEANGFIQSPLGRYLPLRADPDDNAKKACAFLGQGVGADHVQAVMLRFRRELGLVPLTQIHDELVTQVSIDWTDRQCLDRMRLMEEETFRLSGFKAPVKVAVGANWGDAQEIEGQ